MRFVCVAIVLVCLLGTDAIDRVVKLDSDNTSQTDMKKRLESSEGDNEKASPAPQKIDWQQFMIGENDIDQIRIKIDGQETPNSVVFRRTPVEIITTTPVDRNTAWLGIDKLFAVRLALPDEGDFGGGWGGAGMKWGLLELTRKNGQTISISATPVGFAVGPNGANFRTVFYSWILAKLLDDLYFQKTGERLPVEHFEGLSGERWVRSSQRAYANLRKPVAPKAP